jgi:hypothetical protein
LPSGQALNVADGCLRLRRHGEVEDGSGDVALVVLGHDLEFVLAGSHEDLRVYGICESEIDRKLVDVDAHKEDGILWARRRRDWYRRREISSIGWIREGKRKVV